MWGGLIIFFCFLYLAFRFFVTRNSHIQFFLTALFPIESRQGKIIYYKPFPLAQFELEEKEYLEQIKNHCAKKQGFFDYCQTDLPSNCGSMKICPESLGISAPKPCCKLK